MGNIWTESLINLAFSSIIFILTTQVEEWDQQSWLDEQQRALINLVFFVWNCCLLLFVFPLTWAKIIDLYFMKSRIFVLGEHILKLEEE